MQQPFKSLIKFLEIALPLVAIILTCYFNHEKKTVLDIQQVSFVQLTQALDIEDISVSYLYHDSIPVKNLWRTSYVLRNTGETTLFGDGFADKNINGSCIELHVNQCDKLLSITLDTATNGATLKNQNLYIQQWRPREYVSITLFTEGANPPTLTISDRDIKNANITNSIFSPEKPNNEKKIIEYLNPILGEVLKWFYICTAFIIVLAILISLPKTIKAATSKTDKFSSWFVLIALLLIILLPILWMF